MRESRLLRLGALAVALCATAYVVQDIAFRRYHNSSPSNDIRDGVERWLEAGVLPPIRPPVYDMFLGGIMAVWGPDAFDPAYIALQALITCGVLIALFLLAQRTTEHAAWGLIAVGLVSMNKLFIAGHVALADTVLYTAILMALVGLMTCARSRPWFPPAAGVLCALGWLTRPVGVVLLPVVVAVMWRDWRAAGGGVAKRAACALVLSFSLPVLAWAGYQHAHYGFTSISGNSNAENLRLGNNPALMETYPYIQPDRLRQALSIRSTHWWWPMFRSKGPTEEHYREAFRFITESPLDALALVPRKLAAFFVPINFPLGRGMGRQNPDGSWCIENYEARQIGKGDGIMALPGVLAFLAGLVWWKRLTTGGRFIVLTVSLTALIHVVTFAETRFRLPFDPLLALLFVQMASSALLGGKVGFRRATY